MTAPALAPPPAAATQTQASAPAWENDPLYTACASLADWWPCDGHAYNLASDRHLLAQQGLSYGNGASGGAWALGPHSAVMRSRALNASDTIGGSFTLALWAWPLQKRALTPEEADGNSGGNGNQQYAWYPMYAGDADVGAGLSIGTNGVSVFAHGLNYLPSLLVYEHELEDWTHVTVVVRDNRPSLYLNGRHVRTGQRSPRTLHPSFTFGECDRYGGFDGLIDGVMVFDKALDEAEVVAVAAACWNPPLLANPAGGEGGDEAARLWPLLAGPAAPRSLFAVDRLIRAGDNAVAFLSEHVAAAPPIQPPAEELIAALDSDDWTIRDDATRRLIDRGSGAATALREALKRPASIEAEYRLDLILTEMRPAVPSTEELQSLRAIAALQAINSPAANLLLSRLAKGAPESVVTQAAKAARH